MQPQQGKHRQDTREHLSLEASPPNRIGDQWSVTVVATVRKGKFPFTNEEVSFYLSGAPQGSEFTDSFGVAPKTFLLGKGVYEIAARLKSGLASKIHLALKEDIKKPAKVVLDAVGMNGKYELTVYVLTEDGKGIPKISVRVVEECGLEASKNLETNEFGVASHGVHFRDSRRVYFAEAAGQKSESIVLLGPLPKR